uniref:Uncharacterized protein n=1 Tax=Solanum lycopersicum TaxID=4081 RepID=A0A3Q7IDB7_SOLLC
MAWDFSQIMHTPTWNVLILEVTSANGMRHQPRPTYTDMVCVHVSSNISQRHSTSVVRLQPWYVCIGSGLCASVKRQRPMGGYYSQGLHASVVVCVHRLNNIDPGMHTSFR